MQELADLKRELQREKRAREQAEALLEKKSHEFSRINHEINTPIQYVSDNLRFLQESFADLLELAKVCHQMTREGLDETTVSIAKDMLQRADFDFLVEEIPSAIAQSLAGAERVNNFVRAMNESAQPALSNGLDAEPVPEIGTTCAIRLPAQVGSTEPRERPE